MSDDEDQMRGIEEVLKILEEDENEEELHASNEKIGIFVDNEETIEHVEKERNVILD